MLVLPAALAFESYCPGLTCNCSAPLCGMSLVLAESSQSWEAASMDAGSRAAPEQLDRSRREARNGLVAGDEGETAEEGESCGEQRGCRWVCPRLCLAAEWPIQLELPPASRSWAVASGRAGLQPVQSASLSGRQKCFGSCRQCVAFGMLPLPPRLCQALPRQRPRMAVGSAGVCRHGRRQPSPCQGTSQGRILAEDAQDAGSAAPSLTWAAPAASLGGSAHRR